MHWAELLAIAIALAVDAFAVAIAAGVRLKGANRRQTFRLSWHFGFFQAAMLIVGWLAGTSVKSFVESYAHWIAFGLLLWVGGRMILGALKEEEREQEAEHFDPTKGASLVMLAIATSIDALAVGVSLSVLGYAIWFPAFIVGLVALLFTFGGLYIGKVLGSASSLGKYAEIGGGIVLMLIGLNVLLK